MPRKYKILLRQGTGTNVAPVAADFDIGEPAWNSTDGKLYIKNAAGTMVEVGLVPDNSITTAKLANPIAPSVSSLNGGPLAGTRNRVINGAMSVDQRNGGAAQTFTAGAALVYSVDRWYGYCTGANVTGQRVQGATAGQFYYRFTGAASVTAIGFGQRIEQLNSADLAGTTATLSVHLANSLLTTVTWTAFYATTADTFGTLASPTRTQIATGTFTVNSTVTRYSAQISVPAAATTGIEIVFTVGAQTSGTWTIGNVQLESGSVATPFERRSFGLELGLCQRYYETGIFTGWGLTYPDNADTRGHYWTFKAAKRANPTLTYAGAVSIFGVSANGSGVNLNGSFGFAADVQGFGINSLGNAFNIGAATGAGSGTVFVWGAGLTVFYASSEL